MQLFTIQTEEKDEVIDITDKIADKIKKQGIVNGMCSIFTLHTSCALTTA